MKIAALVSGGVDSAVALRILKDNPENSIKAYYLKIWLEDEFQFLGDCPWEEDLKYARAICEQADVPLEVISLQSAYWDRVVSHSVAELKAGRTPSPDILCNQQVKFGAFCDYIDPSYKIATGHYAHVEKHGDQVSLYKGLDPIKDQTYFLSRLSQEQLNRVIFPVGKLPKAEVRRLAKAYELANFDRPDSQGICFLGKIKYPDFVRQHLGDCPGQIINADDNQVVGEHKGFWFHTIGQRKGLGLSGGPWFVVGKDCDQNIIYVSRNKFSDELPKDQFEVRSLHWLGRKPEAIESLSVKIRHGESVIPCQLEILHDQKAKIFLESPDPGIAAGQYAVIYCGNECLGSGVIS
ncbi:MAG: tRNA 2-thiouridine(34) synthase MnmA [Pseudobacteriovorax sp.]|nr:tRNA 2-thiouridine(34) synthase MnmA [Pseudobacteriovorax sp.]